MEDDPLQVGLPEVDFRAIQLQLPGRVHRDATHEVYRPTIAADLTDRAHHDAIPVRVRQPRIGPRPAIFLQAIDVQLAHAHDDLHGLAVDRIPVNVHIGELVVRAERLVLLVHRPHDAIVPDPDVAQGRLFRSQLGHVDRVLTCELARLHFIQPKTRPSHVDVASDVLLLAPELVRLDEHALDRDRKQRRDDHGEHEPRPQQPD